MVTGTIKSAVNLQVLDNKWQQRKNNINEKKNVREMTQDERMLADFQERMDKERESNKHADIYNKLKTGGKLTSEEIDYLKKNDPESLKKYREAQAEKEAYEKALKNCKSKDEVERVKMNKMGEFSAQAKQITTDPYIPLDKKVELMNQMNNRLCLVDEAHMDFVKSKRYLDMPTEEERNRERIEETIDAWTDNSTDFTVNPKADEAAVLEEHKISEPAEEDLQGGTEIEMKKLKEDIHNFVVTYGNESKRVDISV